MPFVVDACSIQELQKERFDGLEGLHFNAVQFIFENSYIAVDEGGHILQEWQDCASYRKFPCNLADWVSDNLQSGKIRLVAPVKDDALKRKLEQLGMQGQDRRYVHVAVAVNADYLASEDSDFYDPVKKHSKETEKQKLREKRNGTVNKYLRKRYCIEIGRLGDLVEVMNG